MAGHEFSCLKKIIPGLKRLNICRQDFDELKILKNYDRVLIGGSNFSVEDKWPRKAQLISLIRKLNQAARPFLGICFGHQLLAKALGGQVIKDLSREEFGTCRLALNARGRKDDLFKNCPTNFLVQEGHKWRVARLPEAMINLASCPKTRIQAIRVKDKPLYGVQFHPELEAKDMLWRANLYGQDRANWYSFDQKKPFKNLQPSPWAKQIIKNFQDLVVNKS